MSATESGLAFKSGRTDYRAAILAACTRPGGVTWWELAEELGLGLIYSEPFLTEFERAGLIKRTGSRKGCAVMEANR
jgi:predicted ArsR family transcriptional regulator